MRDLLILVPTRQRPDNAKRLNASLMASGVDHRFCIDSNDPMLAEYVRFVKSDYLIIGSPQRLGPWLNTASQAYADDYKMIGFIGDDVIPRTPHWNDSIREAYKPRCLIYTNDGHQGEGLPTSVFMDTGLIRKMGYMVYPELVHLYIDNHWKALGEALGTLVYLPDVYLEHMHPFAGKAKSDVVYEAANSAQRYREDEAAYRRFIIELPRIVKRVNG